VAGENVVGPGSYPPPDAPRLSITERDARWTRVRNLMDRDGMDAIVTLHNSTNWDYGNANSRYLSSIGGNCAQVSVVFPRAGAVTAVTGPVPAPAYWREFQKWVDDVRPSFFHPVPVVVERLRELGLQSGRIGIAGLAGVARLPHGLVSVGDYRALEEELPSADFVNATDLLYEARFVKSPEEIATLEHSVSLVESALDVLEREACPGVPERIVYGRMVAALLEHGSEPTSLLLWTAGNPLPPAVGSLASGRPLGPDDVISVEVDAKWAGYLGHGAMTAWVGEPDATVHRMAEVQLEATRRCWDALRPGATLGDVVGVCADVAAGTPFECQPIVHSRGLGMDAPVLVFRARDERTRDWIVEENSVFIVKPQVRTSDGSRRVMWGDTVVVTTAGARRLGRRPAPLASNDIDHRKTDRATDDTGGSAGVDH
jgi:Xaa-Pro dipeptidase